MPTTSAPSRRRAVVIGASLAGLSAARVLAEHFEEVVMIERDALPEGAAIRPGVPQAHQLHLLLQRGQDLYEALFPGLAADLVARGAARFVWGREVAWFHTGGWKQPNGCALASFGCSRALLESTVRDRISNEARIRIIERATVQALQIEGTEGRVSGVRFERRGEGYRGVEELSAALVVDASGRDSKAPAWLTEIGYSPPEEEVVTSFTGYAGRLYRPPSRDRPAWKALLIHPTPPGERRLGGIMPLEGDVWQASLAGFGGDAPPTDEAGFLAFARDLPAPALFEALRDAEPISAIHGWRRTENRLRRHDRWKRRPEGFVALGDAVCTLNPVYGQGMTTAALGATILGQMLRDRRVDAPGFAAVYQRSLGKALELPWMAATREDARFPTTEGPSRDLVTRGFQRYARRLIRRSVDDAEVYAALLRVTHLLASPLSLLAPSVMWRAR
jgi:2-polyprenyl-6-methoxyphenol hydroxylase-like FAD-dependent oxidoreductase